MIYINDDLFTVTSGVLVHGCNSMGVMSAGVAKAFKAKYPEAFKKYVIDIELLKMGLGGLSTFRASDALLLISAITQYNYGRDPDIRYVSYDAVDDAFQKIFKLAPPNVTVNLPKIGAGLGGGSWTVIATIIYNAAVENDFDPDMIHVYNPDIK